MSHFPVAVFHRPCEDIESLLAPYDEQNTEFMQIEYPEETEAEFQTAYQEKGQDYDSFEDFMNGYYGYQQDADGHWGYMTNPDAKWDWWEIGGRYSDMLRLKNGDRADESEVSEVLWEPEPGVYRHALRYWEVNVEGQPLREGERADDFLCFYKPAYYLEQFGTKEKYAETQALTCLPWAFLTADGEWVEAGEMGWWGMHNATQDSRKTFQDAFFDYVREHPELMVTVVDCHI